jgi:hypothetical protein
MRRWLQRARQCFIFAPEPGVKVAGVPANGMLLRALDGRPLVAIDRQGNIGAWGLRAGTVKDITPPYPHHFQAEGPNQQVSTETADLSSQRHDPSDRAPLRSDSSTLPV